MDHPTLGRPVVIANHHAGAAAGDVLERFLGALDTHGLDADVQVTTARGDATGLAQAAAEEGRTLVVAVGGDGTVHEIINGLVDAETGQVRGQDPVLAVVSAGSGCDLVRTFGLDRPPEVIARHVASSLTTRIDLGRVRYSGPDGDPEVRVFANVAEVGFGGAVATAARRLPARLGARRYQLGIVAAWGRFRRQPMVIRHDGGVHEGRLCNVVVANGQFFGGGMKVAPRCLPDDGRLDVQAWGGSPTDVVRAARQLRNGSHLQRSDVRAWPSAQVDVDAPSSVMVEADGELLGSAPASFDVLAHVLRFKV